MCGILGMIDQQNPEGLEPCLRILAQAMAHRGPDGEGFFFEPGMALGMRRLSVIDLNHGWQPLFSNHDAIVAFQNGEIYNFRALRKELQAQGYLFKTASDTEVLAHGFHHWGMAALLERLDGMFAIAIYDRATEILYLARDRFGEKPLFIAQTKDRFAYSSSLTTLAALDWVDDAMHPNALDQYLAVHFVSGSDSILAGVKRVLPGTWIEVDKRTCQITHHRYYLPPAEAAEKIRDAELAEIVERSVVSRLVADVPVGVFLSGGLDSAIVAAIAAKHQPAIDTFSMGFANAEYDESAHAAAVAKAIGSRHHHFHFDENSFMTLLPEVAEALDEPVGDQALLPVYWLAREARKSVTVVLAGEGADEVFAGYGYYREYAPALTWKDYLWSVLGQTARVARGQASHGLHQRFVHNPVPQTPSGFPLLADPADRERLTGRAFPEVSQWEKELIQALNITREPLQRATLADVWTWLPDDLLVKFDRMAMAHSLEGRAPFLAPEVVAAGLQLPASERMTKTPGSSKLALRRIACRWLPKPLLERKKQGFCLPMKAWLVQWFEAHGGPHAYFENAQTEGFSVQAVADCVTADLKAGVTRERLLFALLLFTEWQRAFRQKQKNLKQRLASAFTH